MKLWKLWPIEALFSRKACSHHNLYYRPPTTAVVLTLAFLVALSIFIYAPKSQRNYVVQAYHSQHPHHRHSNPAHSTPKRKVIDPWEKSSEVPDARPEPSERLFVSETVENVILRVSSKIQDDTLRQIFTNCLPSTLDTTVLYHNKTNETFPYTYIITGDIAAMWLRDSTYQVNPYVALARDDAKLRDLILGVINTQAEMINIYPYGNAYYPLKHWNSGIEIVESPASQDDQVYPAYNREEVFEAKYELDSLASFLYLSKHFWEETGDTRFLTNPNWLAAVKLVIQTMKDQQGGTIEVLARPPFTFTRPTRTQSETTNLYGIGNPVKRCGLIRSFFRPSDDSTVFQYLIPSNVMAVVGLEGVATVMDDENVYPEVSSELKALATEVRLGIETYGIVQHPAFGQVYAFEVDCYGSHLLMDDGNFPSLLSLPFYQFVSRDDPVYLNTRNYILSPDWNSFFAFGQFPGVGSPHTGLQRTWHLAQAMQALTSTDESEIVYLLTLLRNSTAGTGLMHESYDVNDPNQYTRSWFAWANTFFGDLILYLEREYPHLLETIF